MKRVSCLFLILVLLITACTAPVNKTEQSIEAAIQTLVERKVQSVKNTNVEELLSMIDPEDKELQTEQSNWLIDIQANPIDDYSLRLMDLEKNSNDEYKAKLRQKYRKDDKEYKLDFYNKYKVIDGKVYDAGNYFEELKQHNITIKYTAENKKLAEDAIEAMNQLYDENIERWKLTPARPMVIKMFDDIEELRQSIKFSMWQCAGWYEYGESVKMYVTKPFASIEGMKHVVNHEMTHLFTVEKSSGNLAYWLSEGIASYYEVPQSQRTPSQLMKDRNIKLLTIEELESIELEKLEDQQQISDYYSNSHIITAFIIEKYGEDKINEILNELSKLPSYKGTTSQNDKYYREYLSQVLPKILGVENYEVFKQQWKNEISRL
jgi:Skp family chaperone for outer membrane proteins